jgi:hypothetical protein
MFCEFYSKNPGRKPLVSQEKEISENTGYNSEKCHYNKS